MHEESPEPPVGDAHDTSTSRNHFLKSVHRGFNHDAHIVLVVDDEPEIRKLVCHQVKLAAVSVLTVEAGNGREALVKLEDIRENFSVEPLLIVTDLNMPVMDGWAFLEHLRQEYERMSEAYGIPVIAMSSTSGDRRSVFSRSSVHGSRALYRPLVTVAKEDCVAPRKYDATGPDGLLAWIRHFVHE